MCKMREITRIVSRILHAFDPALPHFTQTLIIHWLKIASQSGSYSYYYGYGNIEYGY